MSENLEKKIGFGLKVQWIRPVTYHIQPVPGEGCTVIANFGPITSRAPGDSDTLGAVDTNKIRALNNARSRVVEGISGSSLAAVTTHTTTVRAAAERHLSRYRKAGEGVLSRIRKPLYAWAEDVAEALDGPGKVPSLESYIDEVTEAGNVQYARAKAYMDGDEGARSKARAALQQATTEFRGKHGAYALFAAEVKWHWHLLRNGRGRVHGFEGVAKRAGVKLPKKLPEKFVSAYEKLRSIDVGAIDALALRAACDLVEAWFLETGTVPTAEETEEATRKGLTEDETFATFTALVETLNNPPEEQSNFVHHICADAGKRRGGIGGGAGRDHLRRIVPKLRRRYPEYPLPERFSAPQWLKQDTIKSAEEIINLWNEEA